MKYQPKYIILLLLLGLSLELIGQVPMPAEAQLRPTYIVGATAHLGNGKVIENSIIAFEEGKLTIVSSPEDLPKVNLSRYRVIQAKGKHVYPGFIALNTQLGLVEIGQVRASRDDVEIGQLNPSIRSLIAYNTDSEVTPTVRSQGVLLAQVCPLGGRISGQSSVVQLDGWNWEDAAVKVDDGVHLNWPSLYRFSFRQRSFSKNESYDKQIQEIHDFFLEAKAYCQNPNHEQKNLKLEAMRGLFDKSQQLYIHTNAAATISQAVVFAEKYGVSPVIVGGRDAWMVSSLLKEKGVPVVLRQTHNLPASADSDIDQPFKTPKQLQEAGVLFSLSGGGSWTLRNLAFQAGQAVGFGLEYENAISTLTLNPAKILGIDDRVGSLEKGKDATLFICEGDALDMRTSKVSHAFINGRDINLENKQKVLYEKFKTKYERQGK